MKCVQFTWLVLVSATLPVGRQNVFLACQISHAFLMCVVVCNFCPNLITVVSRPPVGCILKKLSPNISWGAWCCISLCLVLNEGCIFHLLSVSAHTPACHPYVYASDDWQIHLCLPSCLTSIWGKKKPVTCCLLWVCWDYRELSYTSQTQPVQDKVGHNEVAHSNIDTSYALSTKTN